MESTASKPALPTWATADAFLFDIDGTLLNAHGGVQYNAFRTAVREHFALEATIDGVPIHGNTDLGILRAVLRREGISDRDFEAKLPGLIGHMCDEVQRNAADIKAEVCPSVTELLARLQGAGKLLGIVSGNLETIGWAKLESADLRRYFAFGSFSDHNELREDIFRHGIDQVRGLLGPRSSVMVIGDTPADISAARKVGIPIVSVATGIFPEERLRELAPEYCVSCCTELL